MVKDSCDVHEVHPEMVREAKKKMLNDDEYASFAQTFGALADSNRTKIIYTLVNSELCVCDIAAVVGISDSAVSQHLRILRNLNLVKQRKSGRMMYYSLNDDHIRTLLEVCLEHTRHAAGTERSDARGH